MINRSDANETASLSSMSGNCVYRYSTNTQAMQGVELERFSLLIDSGLAWLRLSAEMGCVSSNANDRILIEIDYLTEEEVDITSVQLGKLSDRVQVSIVSFDRSFPIRL